MNSFDVMAPLKQELENIDVRLSMIEKNQDDFNKKFIELEAKQNITKFLANNWWKIAISVSPIIFALGELMVYLRDLPPNK